MQEVMAILIVGLMMCGFHLVRKQASLKKQEFYVYATALVAVVILTGFYYSIHHALWTGFSLFTGVACGVGYKNHLKTR